MLSRASHIADASAPDIDTPAEATQIGAGEFYQVMSETLQANYPTKAGLMPWVYKRPWPVVAIQLMDGFGHPTAPYYFLKRTYEETHVLVRLPHLLWTAGETIPLKVAVTHANPAALAGLSLSVDVQDDAFQSQFRKRAPVAVKAGPSVTDVDFGAFTLPEDYQDRFSFVVAELRDAAGKLVSRSTYWPRSLSLLADNKSREEFRSKPTPWPILAKGPWLKPTVAKTQTTLTVEALSVTPSPDGDTHVEFRVRNSGKAPSFMTAIDVRGARRTFCANDNFLWLQPGESRTIALQLHWREQPERAPRTVVVSSWNAPQAVVALP